MNSLREGKVDRTVFSVRRLTDPDDTVAYWLTKTPQERLRAGEELRQIIYGYGKSARMERVVSVDKRGE